MTAASFKDAMRHSLGAKTGESLWVRVNGPQASKTGNTEHPGSRGWFVSATSQDLDPCSVFLWGSVKEDNERAGYAWILTVAS